MKLSLASIALSVFLSPVLVSSRPLVYRANNSTQTQQKQQAPKEDANGAVQMGAAAKGKGNNAVAGAAFFMTNEDSGNFIVASDIGSDGKITLRRAVDAGGLGSHGIVSPNSPDALFSQGSVKTSAASNMLATVNSGSNTLAVFSIDPKNPSNIKMVGKPVGSGGEFPMSLAFNAAGDTVCALNGGAISGVACFGVDKTKGLVPKKDGVRSLNLNQTTPATGPAGTASQVIFSEDQKNLIASVKGVPPQPGFLAVWDIAADGSLSQDFAKIAPGKDGLLPFSMTVIKGKNAVLATDAGVGFDIFDFSKGAKAQSDKSSVVKIDGQKATCWSSFSPKTGNFFLTDIGTGQVTEVNVDDNLKGSIVKQYPQGDTSATIDNDIATVNGKDFMYVMAAGQTSVNVLSLGAPGAATSLQKVDFSGPAKQAGITINANNVQGMTTFVAAK